MQGVKAKTEIVEEHSSPGHMDIPLGGRKKDKKRKGKYSFKRFFVQEELTGKSLTSH